MSELHPGLLGTRAQEVLTIVLREMRAYGHGWRVDWSDFDGRTLRDQLNGLAEWAEKQLRDYSAPCGDFREGTGFEQWRTGEERWR